MPKPLALIVAGDRAVLNLTKVPDDDAVLAIVLDHTALHEAVIADADPVRGIGGRCEISYRIAGAGGEKNADLEACDRPVLDRGPLPGRSAIRDSGCDCDASGATARPGGPEIVWPARSIVMRSLATTRQVPQLDVRSLGQNVGCTEGAECPARVDRCGCARAGRAGHRAERRERCQRKTSQQSLGMRVCPRAALRGMWVRKWPLASFS